MPPPNRTGRSRSTTSVCTAEPGPLAGPAAPAHNGGGDGVGAVAAPVADADSSYSFVDSYEMISPNDSQVPL